MGFKDGIPIGFNWFAAYYPFHGQVILFDFELAIPERLAIFNWHYSGASQSLCGACYTVTYQGMIQHGCLGPVLSRKAGNNFGSE